MKNNIFRDALAPLAARLPISVREHEILRVSGELGGNHPGHTADHARAEVLKWVQNRAGTRLPDAAWDGLPFELLQGGRNTMAIRLRNEGTDIWALRTEEPDKTVAGRIWLTEIVMWLGGGGVPRIGVRLLVTTTEHELTIDPAVPGFVRQLSETCDFLVDNNSIELTPWPVDSDEDVENLVDLLVDAGRRLPVFVISIINRNSFPLLNATELHNATLGLAHVAVITPEAAWRLTERLGKVRSVFGGGARAYMPGFTTDSDPYAHRLELADHIESIDGARRCTRWMKILAANHSVKEFALGQDVWAFREVYSVHLKLEQDRLEARGATDTDQLRAARLRMQDLEKQVIDAKEQLEYFDIEHKCAVSRAETAEQQLRAARSRIEVLLQRLKEKDASQDDNLELPTSWASLTNWCDVHLAGQLVLAAQARHATREPEFKDVRLVANCLRWLAFDYRAKRLNGGEGSLRDGLVTNGIWNTPCGQDEYEIFWEGRTYTVDWHLKNGGNTRDPARCLRIYYFWEESSNQVVVVSMPAHRRTGAS